MSKLHLKRSEVQLLGALLFSSAVSVGFFVIRVAAGHSWRYSFLVWNLFLAWLPLLFAWWLNRWLKKGRWLSWQGILLTALWFGFLPNSFYIVSDLIHLTATGEVGLVFDAVFFVSFAFNGIVLGFISLYLIHRRLMERMRSEYAHLIIGSILLLCSFAIYLGRYLRWNTWDILLNPAGLLFDVSDRVINPAAYPRTFSTTASFFFLLLSIYVVGWQLAAALRATDKE